MVNLICLPFAGGSKYSYRSFLKYSPANLNLVFVELPGRGNRFKESFITDIHLLVEDIYSQVEGYLNEPYAIYGHSMGTLLGYLLTKKIINKNINPPLFLFFTGSGAPSVEDDEPVRYLLPKNEFLSKLKEYGGSPDEVLEDERLMDFFEPILRADFQSVETYTYKPTEPFDIPITVIIGTEERTTYEEALAWQKETTKKIDVRRFPGKHFFIFQYDAEIMKLIIKQLEILTTQP